jgi:predicted ATPase
LFVSISGPPLAGKTTLFNAVREHCSRRRRDITFVGDLVRQTIESLGVGLVESDRAAFQHYVGFRQLAVEAELDSTKLVILDKSLVDAIAYWDVLVGGNRPIWSAQLERDRYGIVVLCDHAEIGETGNEIDLMHASLRDRLAHQIITVSGGVSTKVISVAGSRSQRLDTVLAAIDSL